MKKIINLILSLSVLLFFSHQSYAQYVTTILDTGLDGSLRKEIQDTPSGGTVTFAPTIISSIMLNSELTINKDITISGLPVVGVTIDANTTGRIFNITNGTVTLANLTMINGSADNGGAIFISNSDVTISNSTIEDCDATASNGSGGGIFLDTGGSLNVSNTTFENNTALRAGGAIEDNSGAGLSLVLTNVTLINNNAGVNASSAAPGNGGGVHITGAGSSTITGGTVTGNIALSEGGGLWNGSGTMTVDSTVISNNTASGAGADNGGGGLFNAGGTLIVDNATLTANVADGASGSGGGILNDQGTLTVTGATLTSNTAVRAGGGIEDNSMAGMMLTLTNVTLENNTAGSAPGNGGGLHITGPGNSTVTGGMVSGNIAASEGGGLWNGSGTMTVDATVISNNTASGAGADNGGGGLFNAGGTLIVDNATLTANVADGASGSGGGILNDQGTLTVTGATLTSNTAVRAGGGIEDNSMAGMMLTLTNVTLENNTAGSAPGNGGGLHITGPGNSTVTGGMVSGNIAASEGGGLWNGSGTMTVDATVISNNTASGAGADNGGGGIFNNGGTLMVNNATISENEADGASGSGGAVLSTTGTVTIENTMLTLNSANRAGGAIELINGTINVSNSTLSENDVNGMAGTPAPGNGGAFHVTGMSSLSTFTSCTISENEAGREGGGLWNQSGSTMNVINCSLDANIAAGAGIDDGGGAVFNNGGTTNIEASALTNNMASGTNGSGGAVHDGSGSLTTILTTTISGNTATNSGGGVYNNGQPLMITASTITNNTASTGGGVDGMAAISLKNTITALNLGNTGVNLSGMVQSRGYNLIDVDDLSVFTSTTGDIMGSNPLIGPLQINAGTTMTHELLVNSPAYNAGDSADQYDDQNGQPVFMNRRDIGAFESQNDLTSIGEIRNEVQLLSIYPNPAKEQVVIEVPSDLGPDKTLSIFEMGSGKLIAQMVMDTDEYFSLDIDHLNAGVYTLRLSGSEAEFVAKLIVL